ncbi:SWI/SNF and RSC complexes subunit arp9 [Smittium culicis]|uniref:SWI/SNF and RSC complexes subunit arp9 n=1 Tax=Smittium culicis TaxID=133412 RepID=A0A1R1XRE3_9FUNG|nr:SWI/SNF and RSC complexes subunit arp9 [Smittium culicis]
MAYSFKDENVLIIEFEEYETLATLGTVEINQKPTLLDSGSISTVNQDSEKVNNPNVNIPPTDNLNVDNDVNSDKLNDKMDIESNDDKNVEPQIIDTEIVSTETNSDKKSSINDTQEKLELPETIPKSQEVEDFEISENSAVADEVSIKNKNGEKNSRIFENRSKPDEVYAFGDALNKLPAESISSSADIFSGDLINDWSYFKEFCKFIITKELKISISKNESPTLLSVPHSWTKYQKENITKMLFEEFNVPAMMIIERPVAAIFGNGLTTGLVIDVSFKSTTISSIIDSQLQLSSVKTVPIGGRDILEYLKYLIYKNREKYTFLNSDDEINDFCLFALESGQCGFTMKEIDLLTEEPSNKQSTIEYKGAKVKISK